MTFLVFMKKNYKTEKCDSFKKIDSKKIEELREILLLSPCCINSQP